MCVSIDMKKTKKSELLERNVKENKAEESVRGSGFTYDEAKHPSDQSTPISKDDGKNTVRLPKLNKKNHF